MGSDASTIYLDLGTWLGRNGRRLQMQLGFYIRSGRDDDGGS